jgi:hypothetical protein
MHLNPMLHECAISYTQFCGVHKKALQVGGEESEARNKRI